MGKLAKRRDKKAESLIGSQKIKYLIGCFLSTLRKRAKRGESGKKR